MEGCGLIAGCNRLWWCRIGRGWKVTWWCVNSASNFRCLILYVNLSTLFDKGDKLQLEKIHIHGLQNSVSVPFQNDDLPYSVVESSSNLLSIKWHPRHAEITRKSKFSISIIRSWSEGSDPSVGCQHPTLW
jgi:hypothetical protein